MVDVVDLAGRRGADTPDEARPRRAVPSWVITVGSLVVLLGAWEIFGRDINPVFGSYPSAIAEAVWRARAHRQAVDGAVRQPAAVLRSATGSPSSSAFRSG